MLKNSRLNLANLESYSEYAAHVQTTHEICVGKQTVDILQVQVHNTEPSHKKLIHILILFERNQSCISDMITYIVYTLSSLIFTTIS